MARSSAWKALERKVADVLGGIRIHRGGDFSESLPDVIAPLKSDGHAIIVECKYRNKQPWINYYKNVVKTFNITNPIGLIIYSCRNPITKKNDNMIILSLDNIKDYLDGKAFAWTEPTRRIPKYIKDACIQSKNYILNPDIKDTVQLLYYKATGDRASPPFERFSSMSVIGQKNDSVRLCFFYQSEFSDLNA